MSELDMLQELLEDFDKGIMLRTSKPNARGKWELDVSSLKERKKLNLVVKALMDCYDGGGARLMYQNLMYNLPAQAIVSKDKLEQARESYASLNWHVIQSFKNADGELVIEEQDGKLLIYEQVLYEKIKTMMDVKPGEFDLSGMSNKDKVLLVMNHLDENEEMKKWAMEYPREPMPIYTMGVNPNPLELRWEERWKHMLNFKNSEGEIVMKEHDNGKLSIYDEVLKESLEHGLSLEEAKKKAKEAAE